MTHPTQSPVDVNAPATERRWRSPTQQPPLQGAYQSLGNEVAGRLICVKMQSVIVRGVSREVLSPT